MNYVKSKQRVADHGEVFTPAWMVEAMLDLVKGETERIDSRFLEPACGDGNFLVQILRRKLAAVELKYAKSDFERRHYAPLALMCLYGIELLTDNIAECRANPQARLFRVRLRAHARVAAAFRIWDRAFARRAEPGKRCERPRVVPAGAGLRRREHDAD